MRNVVLLMHTTLDGFVAGPNGEMDWIRLDDELFDDVGKITDNADTALYGRVTYQMMESYWPAAGQEPGASKHDIEHSNWTNNSLKVVFSKTLKQTDPIITGWQNTRVISNNIVEEITNMKKETGKDLLLIGSASIVHTFIEHDVIDEYWINVNPVILGEGIPLSKKVNNKINLDLVQSKKYNCGVMALHYRTRRQ